MSDPQSIVNISPSNSSFVVACIICIVMIIIFIGCLYLYRHTYPSVEDINKNELEMFKIRIDTEGKHNAPETVKAFDNERFDTVKHVFEIQNSFWESFLQATISMIVIGFIVILILLGLVQAQAGLPVLAAIGGAALSKGGASFRSQPKISRKDS